MSPLQAPASRPLTLLAAMCLGPLLLLASSAAAHNLLMIPGPVEFSETVLAAAGGLPLSHMDKGFANEFGHTLEMLRKVFLTETGQPFLIAGSGTLGWDILAANFVEAGEKVLLLNSGYFGDRFTDSMETFGVEVTQIRPQVPGTAPTLEQLEAALTSASQSGSPFKAVTITQVDTSTGVLMDVKNLAAAVRRMSPSTLIVVDGVCSAGAEELRMDEWGVDFILTASQKALGAPPGLCVLMASQKAMQVMDSRRTPIPTYYASLKRWLPIMQAYEARAPKYFATPPVQLVQALHVSLGEILAGGEGAMERRFQQHVQVSHRVKDTVEAWGLQLVTGSRETEAHTLTAIRLPEGIEAAALLPRIVARGVMVAGGLLPELRYFRIGHMHLSSTHPQLGHIDTVLAAVKGALEESGYQVAKPEIAAGLKAQGWVPRGATQAHDEL